MKPNEKDVSDVSFLSEIGKENIQNLYDYANIAYNRTRERFSNLDSKAYQTISTGAIISGILVFVIPSSKTHDKYYLLFFGLLCFILAALCCLLCLLARSTLEPTTIERAIKWIYDKKSEDIKNADIEMISALIIDYAKAERKYNIVCRTKSIFLTIGQFFEVGGIIFLLIYVLFSRTTFF